MIRRALYGLATALVVLVAVLVARTLWPATPVAAAADAGRADVPAFDTALAVQRFAGALRLPAVSTAAAPPPKAALDAFQAYLAQQFPRLHQHLRKEVVGHGSLLYTWAGRDPTLKPVILMAHQDTVPVEADSRAQWHRDPFSGEVADGMVWGRGALDDRASLVSQMQAVELLLEQGFVPRRTLMLAYGDDEERGGEGADAIVALLRARGVHAEFVLDEGGAVARDALPGVPGTLALVGISEKGYASAHLAVALPGGHSSQPAPESSITVLSRAMVRLAERQMPPRLTPAVAAMLDAVAPQMAFGQRLVVRNRWLFGPLLLRTLARTPAGNALVRTTTAETMFNAGVKDNVLPTRAAATVNFRLLPGDSLADLERHVRRAVDDPRVEIAFGDQRREASPVSPVDGAGFRTLSASIRKVLGAEVRVVPFQVVATTDSSHYAPVSDAQYRFIPYRFTPEAAARFHGLNEGIPVEDYLTCVRFAHQLIRDVAG